MPLIGAQCLPSDLTKYDSRHESIALCHLQTLITVNKCVIGEIMGVRQQCRCVCRCQRIEASSRRRNGSCKEGGIQAKKTGGMEIRFKMPEVWPKRFKITVVSFSAESGQATFVSTDRARVHSRCLG